MNVGWGNGGRVAMRVGLLMALGALWAVCSGTAPVSIAAERSEKPTNEPVAESAEEPPEPVEGERRPLRSRLLGATPEERARLQAERERLSEIAAENGTDPTAIIGLYQLSYGHTAFTNNLRLDSATAVARLPITPNLLLRVTMPYVWADLNGPRGFTTNGASDMAVRLGGRLYASPNVALFVGTDALFPTASEKQLGTGKYTLGPGGAVAVPLPRLRSLLFVVIEDVNSVGGDPSRASFHYMQVQTIINTIWSERWWTVLQPQWFVDWDNRRKTTMILGAEVGHRLAGEWRLFVQPGVGVMGRDTPLGVDWTVQAGVRWMFETPIFSQTFREKLFGN